MKAAPHKKLHKNGHNTIIHNDQKLLARQMSNNIQMDEQM
jgi:hypothetical protein